MFTFQIMLATTFWNVQCSKHLIIVRVQQNSEHWSLSHPNNVNKRVSPLPISLEPIINTKNIKYNLSTMQSEKNGMKRGSLYEYDGPHDIEQFIPQNSLFSSKWIFLCSQGFVSKIWYACRARLKIVYLSISLLYSLHLVHRMMQ